MAPKKKVGSSSKTTASGARRSRRRARSPTPPPPLSPILYPLENATHLSRYRTLHDRTIIPSKFFDPYTVNHLGLAREVRRLLANAGWERFYSIQAPTYKELTLEFLSSFNTTYQPYGNTDAQCITFRCLGIDRSLNLGEFNAIFGFPNTGMTWLKPEFDPDFAWRELTGLTGTHSARQSKASQLQSPAMRYIHRVMTSSIFGKGESTGVLGQTEVLFLWAMQHRIQVNTGVWILKHLLQVSHSTRGRICVGGLITVIAQYFGFHPSPDIHTLIRGSFLVDFELLARMKMVTSGVGGGYQLIAGGGDAPHDEEEEAFEEPEEQPNFQQNQDEHNIPSHSFSEAGPSEVGIPQIIHRLERLETGQAEILYLLRRMEKRRAQSDDAQSDSDE